MLNIRKQLSLYVPGDTAIDIEAVRNIVDPIQSNLIPAHVTLCREDELHELASIKARLAQIPLSPIKLRFGKAEVFSGHGLLLKCLKGENDFRLLREYLLASKNIRNQSPHITLAHPRNPQSVGNSLNNTFQLPDSIEITFPTVYLIEQSGNSPWRVLETYSLSRDSE